MPSYIANIDSFYFGPFTSKEELARELGALGFKELADGNWQRGEKFHDYASIVEILDKERMATMFSHDRN